LFPFVGFFPVRDRVVIAGPAAARPVPVYAIDIISMTTDTTIRHNDPT